MEGATLKIGLYYGWAGQVLQYLGQDSLGWGWHRFEIADQPGQYRWFSPEEVVSVSADPVPLVFR